MRRVSLAAGLTLPVLLTGALALPVGRAVLSSPVAWTGSWFSQPDVTGRSVFDRPAPAVAGTDRGWGVTVWPPQPDGPAAAAVLPLTPPRPSPPARPWEDPSSEWKYPLPDLSPAPPTLSPVQRLTQTVAAGATVTIPRGAGQPHLLCTGPTTPNVLYWLESTKSAGTLVHRYDGSGVYDFSYRYATTNYLQDQPCS